MDGDYLGDVGPSRCRRRPASSRHGAASAILLAPSSPELVVTSDAPTGFYLSAAVALAERFDRRDECGRDGSYRGGDSVERSSRSSCFLIRAGVSAGVAVPAADRNTN